MGSFLSDKKGRNQGNQVMFQQLKFSNLVSKTYNTKIPINFPQKRGGIMLLDTKINDNETTQKPMCIEIKVTQTKTKSKR